jgi:hypothetical protein
MTDSCLLSLKILDETFQPSMKYFHGSKIKIVFVIVVPKYLKFATFSKNALVIY